MKKVTSVVLVAIMAVNAVSCNQSSKKIQLENDTSAGQPSQSIQDSPLSSSVNDTSLTQVQVFSIAPIVADYLELKNALASDNDKAAAGAGEKLFATLSKIDASNVSHDLHQEYNDIANDAKEHAEHIGENIGNIKHQREHLALLSEGVKDLIALFGTSQTLYEDHCPMFNNSKGAIWLSESKEIKNPYYGPEMLTCGTVRNTISAK